MVIYKIKWRDSSMYHSQEDNDYPFEISVFESIGFLIKEDKEKIVIARDILSTESRSVLCIPKENIIKIKKI
jgi:hypothetical protein